MPTKYPALAALGAMLAGGALVVFGLDEAAALVRLGVAVAWLGLVVAVGTVFVVLRALHRAGERAARDVRQLRGALGGNADVPADLVERLDDLDRAVARAMQDHEREVLRVLDVRLLALHEQLRDADRAPGT